MLHCVLAIAGATSCAYRHVELPSFGRASCSPEPPDDIRFRGLLINAPSKVSFRSGQAGEDGAFAHIPVCGYVRQRVLLMPERGAEATRFIAVDRRSGQEHSGALCCLEGSGVIDPDAEPLPAEALQRIVVGVYFNGNLVTSAQLPQQSGIYDVHLELGERGTEGFLESETVAIEVRER